MDEGVAEARRTPGARLVDVREEGEFLAGHVPDAANVPLSQLGRIADVAQDRATPLFLYCASGARSARAARELVRAGYADVCDIGGINDYTGPRT